MVNHIFPSRSGVAGPTPTADKSATPTSAVEPAAATSAATRSVGARVLGGLGLLLAKKSATNASTRSVFPTASLMPSQKMRTAVAEGQAATGETLSHAQDKILETSICQALPGLEKSEASRVQRLLDRTMRAGDPTRRTLFLKMLAADVQTAVARQNAPPPTSLWQSLTRTSVNDNFQGNVANLSKSKALQLLQLQRDIKKLAPEFANSHQAMLRDILASKQSTSREDRLNRLIRQVAMRSGVEPEA